jgi:hypothetical protein
MGEYFCDICKFYDDDVSEYWVIIYWDDWQYDELILGLLWFNCGGVNFLQTSKQQFHCDSCGICRLVKRLSLNI